MSHTSRTSWISRNAALTGCGAVLALVTLTACGGTDTAGDAAKPGDTAASKPAASKSPDAAPAKKTGVRGSGTYKVGSDIQPGTYRSTNNGDNCYWERAKDASGEADSILDNENAVGSTYVTIEASDKIFKSQDCKDWAVVDPKAAGTPKAEAAGKAGMLKVGVDIAPGTYKSAGTAEGGTGCYWERTKDASGTTDSIIANENPTGQAIVTIAAGDGYFKTVDCQDWKKE